MFMSTVIGNGSNPGEIGVLGESQEAEGVRGIGHKGAGVSGTSEKWIGTYGESQEAEGVRGVGHKGAGVSGTSEKWIGTYGESQEAEGVRGVGHKGAGVSGTSRSWHGVAGESQSTTGGVGVYGKGVRAGLFEGNVDITGNLTVQGVSIQSLLQRIVQLEQQLGNRPASGDASSGTISSSPQISVVREGSGQGSLFVIQGTGFSPNKLVTVRVVDEQLTTRNFQQNADASGKLGLRQSIPCVSGKTLHFSATDSRPNSSDATGVLWSNTFTTTCP
jgi:hypothetical protein